VEAISASTSLSTDPLSPTVFQMHNTVVFPKGESLRDLTKPEPVILPADLRCELKVKAAGVLVATTFLGSLEMEIEYRIQTEGQATPLVTHLLTQGEFEFQLK
jgi:hypothetical protein